MSAFIQPSSTHLAKLPDVPAMLHLCCVNLAGCCDRSGLSPVTA